jgi:Arc/MetJ family transcription regulator
MRTMPAVDDDLVGTAQAPTGLEEKPSVMHEALKLLSERETTSRLARLGGSEPELAAPRRRRSEPA